MESLVGRYGVLALATICALAMVGTFLGWAVRSGYLDLGPRTRVGLGFALAVFLAAYGHRLRRHERSFGGTLLGLALAILHVCAWAAGPSLGLVEGHVALMLASLASAALALLAYRDGDEPLWCVGFGGAAIAPFVTTTGEGSALLLFGYAAAVLLSGSFAIARRSWPVAGRVQSLAMLLFAATLGGMPSSGGGPLLALALVALVAAALVHSAAHDVRRSWLRGCGIIGVLAALNAAGESTLPFSPVPFAIAALLAWLLLVRHTADEPAGELVRRFTVGMPTLADWIDGAWIPIGLIAASLEAIPASAGNWIHASFAGAAAVSLLWIVSGRPQSTLRDALAFATSVSMLLMVWYARRELPATASVGLLGAVGMLLLLASRRWHSLAWVSIGIVSVLVAALGAYDQLAQRPRFGYMPFGTQASALALGMTVALAFGVRLLDGARNTPSAPEERERQIDVPWLPLGFAFLWIYQELSRAVNATVATLLVVTYFAATSVAGVHVGRARGQATLRHAGLLLAVLAAAKALHGARTLEVGPRLLAYLVAAVFLLGIAYWYRDRASEAPSA